MGMIPPRLLLVPADATDKERMRIGIQYMNLLRRAVSDNPWPFGKKKLLRRIDRSITKMELRRNA